MGRKMISNANIRELLFFAAVYEEGSFTRAAKRENATQPGVSQHIRNLERRFKVRLFKRSGRLTVEPTPAANRLYRKCMEILRGINELGVEMQVFKIGLEGELTVGLMPALTRSILAPALARFSKDNPNVVVRVVEGYSGELTDKVLSGELDFAIVPAQHERRGLVSRRFARTQEILVSAKFSGLPRLKPVHPSTIKSMKLVVPGIRNSRRRGIEIYMASCGANVVSIMELDAMMGTLDFIERTDWVAILPAIMMLPEVNHKQLTLSLLTDPPLTLDLVEIEPSRRPLSAEAKAFLAVLKMETDRANDIWHKAAQSAARRRRRMSA